MRFGLALIATFLCTIYASAERVNPKVEALLAKVDERLAEDRVAAYSDPGEAKHYATLLRAFNRPPDEIGSPSEEIFSPVQVYPNGDTKVEIWAGMAWFSDDLMTLRGKNVKVYSYYPDGTQESVIATDEILFDRKTMRAAMRGYVTIEMGTEKLSGNGALADFNTQYIRLLRQAKIVTARLNDVNLDETKF